MTGGAHGKKCHFVFIDSEGHALKREQLLYISAVSRNLLE